MSAPGFVIVSDDEESSSVHTAVIDDAGNQIIVSLEEASNYKPFPVSLLPQKGVLGRDSEELKKLVRVQYKCDHCEKLFRVSLNLRDHRKAVHQVNDQYNEYPCEQCGIICLNNNQLNLHMYRSHGNGTIGQKIVLDRIKSTEEKRTEELEALVIKDESMKMSVVEELRVLETKSDPKRPRYVGRQRHQCLLCSKNFSTPSMLQRHQSVHSGIKPFPCPYCSKSYSQSEHLQRHIRTAHPDRVNTTLSVRRKPLWHVCKACGQRFTAKHRYIEHLQVHVNGLFECHVCAKKFSIKNSLLRHVASHQGHDNYKCNVCSKYFVNLTSLKNHSRVHDGSYPFTCSICDKGFAKKSRLLEHVEKHLSEVKKLFGCGTCSFVSVDLETVQEHRQQQGHRVKSKVSKQTSSSQTPLDQDENDEMLPFKCYSCLLPFKDINDLTNHCQIFHKFIITNAKGWSMYTCDPCCKSFDSGEVLREHLKLHNESGVLIHPGKTLPEQNTISLPTFEFVEMVPSDDASKSSANISAPQTVETLLDQVHQAEIVSEFANPGSSSTVVMLPVQQGTTVPDSQDRVEMPGQPTFQTSIGRTELTMSTGKDTAPQIQSEILYKIDESGKLYGISENGTLYEVVTSDSVLMTADTSTWPPTEQQMESGDLLLDIVAQGSCLPLSEKQDKSHLIQHLAAEKVVESANETATHQLQSELLQSQNIGNIQTIT